MKTSKLIILIILAVALIGLAAVFLSDTSVAVLDPKGTVAAKQRDLIITSTLLMLVIVVPVFVLTFLFAWKFREGNKKSQYRPDWDHNRLIESLWWAIPSVIILVLAVITWKSSHALDPTAPLDSNRQPITIQVVALQWKWLFIYPEHNVAALNFVQFPEDTPVKFEVTADAPTNSFWIPRLGGQIYAMAGMKTNLNLMASEPGSFPGSSANISGQGFSGMRFVAKSTTTNEFDSWLEAARNSQNQLTWRQYTTLAKPSKDNRTILYSAAEPGIYDRVINKYTSPGSAGAPNQESARDVQ